MSEGKRNMEEFLREKFNDLESNFNDDWDVFEQKLERALFFKRLKVGAALAVFLIATSIGIFGTSSIIGFGNHPEVSFGIFTEDGYQSAGSQGKWKSSTSQKSITESQPSEQGISENPKDQGEAITTSDIGSQAADGFPHQQIASETGAYPVSRNPILVTGNPGETSDKGTAGVGKTYSPVEEATHNPESGEAGNVTAKSTAGSLEENTVALKGGNKRSYSNSASGNTTPGSVAGITGSSVQNTAISTEPNESPDASSASAYTSFEEYQLNKDQPINTRAMQLELQPLTAMAGEDALAGLQVRMPPPAFKSEPKKREPYISPLQERSPWEFSIKVYPNFTFRKFKVDEDKAHLIHRDFIDQVRVSESGGFSLNVGMEVSRRIGPATYLNSGLEYISYKTDANFDFINFRTANIDDRTGAISSYTLRDNPEQIVINDQNTYHYLNVPFSISYKPWASEHIRLNVEAGISYMHFLTARGQSIDYRTLEIIDLSEREFRRSIGSMNLRLGATYYISPQFNLGFEPTFVYFTNTIYTEEYPFEVIPYSVGLNLKLQVKLN